MPRSSSRFSTPGWASWLLAPPQTILARQHLDDLVGERAAQGVGRVDVERLARPGRRWRRPPARPGYSSRTRSHGGGVDVGHHDARAVLGQVAHEVAADLADAGDADGPAGQRGLAPDGLGGGAHALEHAVRREHRRVARAAVGDGAAGDEVALAGDDVHVLGEGADVAGGEVATVAATARSGRRRAAAPRSSCVAGSPMMTALPPPRSRPGQRVLVGHARGRGSRRRGRPSSVLANG